MIKTSDYRKIRKQAARKNPLAERVLSFYRLYVAAPADPGAQGLLNAAYSEWKKKNGTDQNKGKDQAAGKV